MAPDSFDDRYVGCTETMEKLVNTEYLRKELEKSGDFRNAWEAGKNQFKAAADNLKRNHLIAMYVYTLDTVYGDFNAAVRTGKKKYKDKTFKWFSLHFLLTKALQILKKTQKKSYSTIYRGTRSTFKGERDMTFRFGSFTSFSLNKVVAQGFARIPGKHSGTGTCFEISDYKGAEVSKYSRYPGEKEVLIPPYEMFKVTDVRTNDWCNTVFVLKSAGEKSYLNCALIKTNILSKLYG
ncbi:NAD(P)(+)--arginine ADP-ribosyltransferase 2-like [Megalobrama amblycephala]|uniref:NAD(P)(+)--arginine ADP-ribosyltransferase 2-like n=1 Tax=Megalobrama amblycephala TaxID=75352 RepID=UPI002013C4EF|nr:NAD(P)(+)--arginine ADP-ribosyltransferase 2-like [Megalobrama amblycephala]